MDKKKKIINICDNCIYDYHKCKSNTKVFAKDLLSGIGCLCKDFEEKIVIKCQKYHPKGKDEK